jgi:hypothetical protein
MSGHGQREARLRADAVAWRDRISHDMISAAGIAAVFFKPGIAAEPALAPPIRSLEVIIARSKEVLAMIRERRDRIVLRIPPGMRQWLEAQAKRDLRSRNAQIISIIRAQMTQMQEERQLVR